jgi:hypothetical protein
MVGSLEIWNWTTCEKITVRKTPATLSTIIFMISTPQVLHMNVVHSFEFLSATSFLIPCDGRLEVYEIPVQSPGAPPTHTASFCMPHPNPGYIPEVHLIPRIINNIDDGDCPASFSRPSPPFRVTEESRHINIIWSAVGGGGDFLEIPFQVPLSSLLRSAMYPDSLAIPWDAWSRDVYFVKETYPQIRYHMSGERLIHLTHSSNSHCVLSLFDLNRSRATALDTTDPNLSVDGDQLVHVMESQVLPLGEIRMERPRPVHVASRSLSLGEYLVTYLICDDEHIVIKAVRYHIYICGFIPRCRATFID